MNLADYRKQLDRIDAEILQLFEERMNVVREIGIWKKQNGIPVLDAGREAEKLETLSSGHCLQRLWPSPARSRRKPWRRSRRTP